MNSEKVISIQNLTKEYKLYSRKRHRLLEAIFPFYRNHNIFKAVQNLSFDANKGEAIGILGENGAGKSTLLKMITGVVNPSSGTISVNGKISSLLELGVAFNPELTGIENIYQHGQIMGLSNKEINNKKDEIINFADIGNHIHQPVKTYSSGMFSRLAFACAINIEPDILIVDEVLSVGDMSFQEKSITRMKEIIKNGATILFVSHSLPAIKNFCNRVIWMKDGRIVLDGATEQVTEKYKQSMIDAPRDNLIKEKIATINKTPQKATNKSIKITEIEFDKEVYNLNDDIIIKIKIQNVKNINNYGVGIIINNSRGEMICAMNSVRINQYIKNSSKIISFKIKNNRFTEDKYYVTVSICDEKILFSYDRLDYAKSFNVKLPKNSFGALYSEGTYACDYYITEE